VLEKKYGGTYHSHIGKLSHIHQVTQFASGFAVTCFAQLAVAPNEATFEGLKRQARFLATHLHTPIFYPRQKLKGYQTIRFEYEPGKFLEHVITNLAHICVDADHAQDIKTRKSVSCVIAAIHGVIVHWITAKQTCVAAHSTDAEMRAIYTAIRVNKYLRCVLQFIRHDMTKSTTTCEDNKAALDIMATGHITSRVKHITVPIAIIHEELKNGNAKGEKISGKLNPEDLGTKPLPASGLHRISPSPDSKHGNLCKLN
jgi:hypothetical protein